MVVPFIQLKIFNYTFRLFFKRDEMLYKWHSDEDNRLVHFYPIGKWQYQENDKLPVDLKCDTRVFIDKGIFHRIIRKSGFLLAIIKHY